MDHIAGAERNVLASLMEDLLTKKDREPGIIQDVVLGAIGLIPSDIQDSQVIQSWFCQHNPFPVGVDRDDPDQHRLCPDNLPD